MMQPMSPAGDYQTSRSFECDRCGGAMTCAALTQFRSRGANVGREYVFRCSCGNTLRTLDGVRWAYYALILPLFIGFTGLLLFYGVSMLIDTITHGFGGNDASAVIVVLVLFLGFGGLLAVGLGWMVLALVRDVIAARRMTEIHR